MARYIEQEGFPNEEARWSEKMGTHVQGLEFAQNNSFFIKNKIDVHTITNVVLLTLRTCSRLEKHNGERFFFVIIFTSGLFQLCLLG